MEEKGKVQNFNDELIRSLEFRTERVSLKHASDEVGERLTLDSKGSGLDLAGKISGRAVTGWRWPRWGRRGFEA